MQADPHTDYAFDNFRLDVPKRRLLRDGAPVRLNPKAFDLLLVLVENSGKVLSKEDLFRLVWHEQIVEESNLTVHMSQIRKALGEKANYPRYITTISGEGYRFVGEVRSKSYGEQVLIENRAFTRIVVDEEETEVDAARARTIAIPAAQSPRLFKRLRMWQLATAGLVLVAGLAVAGYLWIRAPRSAAVPFADPSQLQITKLTTNGKTSVATLSPDGRFAVFGIKENDGESLWLRQIQSGSQTRISAPQAVQFVGLTVSPDNAFVYCSVFIGNKADTELWRLPILGGPTETVPNLVTGTAISFSPDGKQFAFTVSHQPETFLKVADADGKNQRTLLRAGREQRRTLPIFNASPLAWSPQGDEIAVVVEVSGPENERAGILLIDPQAGSEHFLVEPRLAFIDHLAWLDNEHLAFVGYENDEWKNQIWLVSNSTGQMRRLTNDTHDYIWLAGAVDKLLTVQRTGASSLLIAERPKLSSAGSPICPAGIENCGFEVREIHGESGNLSDVAWAADDSVLYSSAANGKREIWRANADGSGATQLTVDASIAYGLSVSALDGSIFFCRDQNGRQSLWWTDASGKNMRQLTDGTEDLWPDFAPSLQAIFFQRGFDNNPKTIWRMPATGGTATQLTSTTSVHPLVSPDGERIAYFFLDAATDRWRIGLMSSKTASFVGALDIPSVVAHRRLAWHPGGQFLTLGYNIGDQAKILLLPLDGGASLPLLDVGRGEIGSFVWSRDGQKLLVARHAETRDVVLISNKE
jgi:DNA-binding winged helix-turn-helix (wHTH) protein/WD40 repeat protein